MKLDKDTKELYAIIRRFDKENWLKMTTTADLAKEITDKWCKPTQIISKYDGAILQIIKKIKEGASQQDGSLDEYMVDEILLDLADIIKGEK